MKKGELRFFYLLTFLILFLSSTINAQPPFTGESSNMDVVVPRLEVFGQNQNYTLNVHSFNETDVLDNTTVSCYSHAYNFRGEHILNNQLPFNAVDGDWELFVDPNNFSDLGEINLITWCNSSGQTGFIDLVSQVTKSGTLETTANSLFYILLSIGVLILFSISLYFNLTLPSGNIKDDAGAIIKVARVKYLKFMMILVTYPLGLWFLNILILISDNFVRLSHYSGFFSFIFLSLMRLSFPLFIFVFVIILFNIVKDSNINKMIKKRGKAE
jgi:hypothetical protein